MTSAALYRHVKSKEDLFCQLVDPFVNEFMNRCMKHKKQFYKNIVIALGIKSVFLILGALGIAGMWEAIFGDVGVTIIAVLNAMRILKK